MPADVFSTYTRIPASCNTKYWHQSIATNANHQLVRCMCQRMAVPTVHSCSLLSSLNCCTRSGKHFLNPLDEMPDTRNKYRGSSHQPKGCRYSQSRETKVGNGLKKNGREKKVNGAARQGATAGYCRLPVQYMGMKVAVVSPSLLCLFPYNPNKMIN